MTTQGGGKGDSALVDFGNQDDATWLMMLDSILEEMAQVIDTPHLPPVRGLELRFRQVPAVQVGCS